MVAIVEDGLLGGEQLGVGAEGFAAVGIAVEAGEIAAGNLQADAVPLPEEVAGDPEINLELRGLARFKEGRLVRPVAVLGAHDAIAQVVGLPVRMHVHQLAREVSVAGAGSGPETSSGPVRDDGCHGKGRSPIGHVSL